MIFFITVVLFKSINHVLSPSKIGTHIIEDSQILIAVNNNDFKTIIIISKLMVFNFYLFSS